MCCIYVCNTCSLLWISVQISQSWTWSPAWRPPTAMHDHKLVSFPPAETSTWVARACLTLTMLSLKLCFHSLRCSSRHSRITEEIYWLDYARLHIQRSERWPEPFQQLYAYVISMCIDLLSASILSFGTLVLACLAIDLHNLHAVDYSFTHIQNVMV